MQQFVFSLPLQTGHDVSLARARRLSAPAAEAAAPTPSAGHRSAEPDAGDGASSARPGTGASRSSAAAAAASARRGAGCMPGLAPPGTAVRSPPDLSGPVVTLESADTVFRADASDLALWQE